MGRKGIRERRTYRLCFYMILINFSWLARQRCLHLQQLNSFGCKRRGDRQKTVRIFRRRRPKQPAFLLIQYSQCFHILGKTPRTREESARHIQIQNASRNHSMRNPFLAIDFSPRGRIWFWPFRTSFQKVTFGRMYLRSH